MSEHYQDPPDLGPWSKKASTSSPALESLIRQGQERVRNRVNAEQIERAENEGMPILSEKSSSKMRMRLLRHSLPRIVLRLRQVRKG